MINGLQFDMPGEELFQWLNKRTLHHAERAKFYAQQAKAFRDGKGEGFNYSSGNPLEMFDRKDKEHQAMGQKFDFMAEHVVRSETYRLSDSDLVTVEIIERRY